MTERHDDGHDGDEGAREEHGGTRAPRRRHSRRLRFGILALALIALGAVTATALQAVAHGGMRWHGHHGAHGVEELREHAVDRTEWLLDAVDADEEQRAQMNAIVTDLVTTLHPFAERHRAGKRELVAELTQPAPDADALESLRTRQIALIDEVSREAVSALARAAEVLTPEQRIELVERMRRFRHR